MKKVVTESLSLNQKKGIALHTQECINIVFKTPSKDKIELLKKQVEFVTTENLNEKILNQTLIKAMFSRASYPKKQLMEALPNKSQKLYYSNPQEKSDIRFIVEASTANAFAETQESIVKINLNSEKPNTTLITSSGKNMYNDYTLSLKNNMEILLDKKSGNNAYKPFSGSLGEIAYTQDNKIYTVINKNDFDLNQLQKVRLQHLSNKKEEHYTEIYKNILEINEMSLTIIQKNILIQEKIFNILANKIITNKPSFIVAKIMSNQPQLHSKFFEKLEPYINENIFDDAKKANLFMIKSITVFNETVYEIAKNISSSKNGWEGTGFENINTDLFK